MARSRNAELVSSELRRFGMNDLKVNALVGGFIQESGAGLNPTVSHDGGTGFGIAGFRDPKPGVGRWTNLRNFASANGWDVNDPVTQARFTAHELGYDDPVTGERMRGPGYNAEARASAMMRNATSIEGAARGAIAYERPQHFSWDRPEAGHGYAARLNNARGLAGLPPSEATAQPRPYDGNGIPGALAHAPTVERAAAMEAAAANPDLAAAQAMRPHTTPETPDVTLRDLTSLEGWGRALKNEDFSNNLKGVLSNVTGQGGEDNGQSGELSIDPAIGLSQDDFSSRFAAASQMFPMRRPRGVLSGVL